MDSIDKIHSGIEHAKSRLAGILSSVLATEEVDLNKLEVALEWFITWRIKLENLDYRMWCDGVSNLDVTIDNDSELSVYATVYLGPESDVSTIYKGILQGWFKLVVEQGKIDSFDLAVSVNDKTYTMTG